MSESTRQVAKIMIWYLVFDLAWSPPQPAGSDNSHKIRFVNCRVRYSSSCKIAQTFTLIKPLFSKCALLCFKNCNYPFKVFFSNIYTQLTIAGRKSTNWMNEKLSLLQSFFDILTFISDGKFTQLFSLQPAICCISFHPSTLNFKNIQKQLENHYQETKNAVQF